tara:strand:+ start:3 stop:1658 length:1656 start_codon:yes stop_codon:yes gene_type:complete
MAEKHIFDMSVEKELTNTNIQNTNYTSGKYVGNSKYNFWSRYMGPYCVANSIREHCPQMDVVVLDYFTKLDNFFEVFEQLVTVDTEYVALSVTFLNNPFNPRQKDFNLWHFSQEECLQWFKRIKEIAPNAKILIGGAIVDTIYKQKIVQKKTQRMAPVIIDYVDVMFHGYSERTIVDYLNGTLDESQKILHDTVLFVNEPALAGKGAVVNQTKWSKKDCVQPNEWLPLEISKGCRFGCKFCFYDTHGTVIKDPDVLRKELLYNYKHFGTTGYQLTDDTVNDSLEKIEMMHDVITSLPFKIEWISYARPDMFHKYPQMLPLMLDMGCRGMFLGIETLNHTAGKICGKGLDPQKIKGIIKWIRETAGEEVFLTGSFIIGLVGETEESLMDTASWLNEQQYLNKAQYEILFIADDGGRTSNQFSESQDKYGIHELRWNPEYYWKHATMDLTRAKEIAVMWENMLSDHPYTGFERHADYNTSFWAYPRLRSFGLNHHTATKVLSSKSIPDIVYQKNLEWISNYHGDIIKTNQLSVTPSIIDLTPSVKAAFGHTGA